MLLHHRGAQCRLLALSPLSVTVKEKMQEDTSTEIIPVSLNPQPGRIAHRIKNRNAIEKAELYLRKNLPKYLKNIEKLANGISAMKINRQGEEEIFLIPPDRQANEYLIDRGMGKAPSRVEITGEGGGPLQYVAWAGPEELERNEMIIEGEAREIA